MNAFQALLASLLDEMKTWPEFAAFQHWSDGEGTVVAGGKQPLVPDATKEIAASTDVPKEVAAAAADAAKEIEAAITSAEGKGEAEATKLAQVQAGSNADGKLGITELEELVKQGLYKYPSRFAHAWKAVTEECMQHHLDATLAARRMFDVHAVYVSFPRSTGRQTDRERERERERQRERERESESESERLSLVVWGALFPLPSGSPTKVHTCSP